MRNKILYLFLCIAMLPSCEEYYTPSLDVVEPLLVVDSHLSNNPSDNFIKLTMTQDFYNATETQKVSGAKVELIESGGTSENGTETSTGYFTFKTVLVAGKNYFIRITRQTDTYESKLVTMPPLPRIDTLYTENQIIKSYTTDAYGSPVLKETPSRTIFVDAPVSPMLQYYRFDYNAVLQWVYLPPSSGFGPPPPAIYGWKSAYQNGEFNLAGPKQFSTSDKIERHPIRSLAYDGRSYLDSAAQIPAGWIFILNQYGITKSSYDFHETLNKQFSAQGSLFDPVLTQVYGNIRCTSDPGKTVLGFFDLNSYRQYRYFLNLGDGDNAHVVQRRLNRYPVIPADGHTQGFPPPFWETNY